MSEQPTVADYNVRRLAREGITDCFGVAGGFAFKLDDAEIAAARSSAGSAVPTSWMRRTRPTICPGRASGCSMLCTTYAVGELSALNGVTGAGAERSCIFHLVGMPTMRKQRVRQIVHHTLGDGEFQNFANIAAQAAWVSAVITPDKCAHEMERLIATARAESRRRAGDGQRTTATCMPPVAWQHRPGRCRAGGRTRRNRQNDTVNLHDEH